ncbi:MAG: hypothetical protein WDN75_15760 [Bacteroidota bacterium]
MDIKLRQLSGGEYGMQNLMADLSKKYGKSHAFRDDALFEEIEKLTYPEIGDFLRRYVGGPERLPFAEVFDLVGVSYTPEKDLSEFSLGYKGDALGLVDIDGKKKLSVAKAEGLTDQGRNLGLQKGDILLKINQETIPEIGPELNPFLEKQKSGLTEGGRLTYTVVRKDEKGQNHELVLESVVTKVEIKRKHVMTFNEEAPVQQLELRKSWISVL